MKQLIARNSKFLIPALVFVSRLGIFPANVSPLGSYGFHSKKFFLFGAIVILFDYLVGGIYPGHWITYLGFAAYPILGKFATSTTKKIALIPVASFLFFLISNTGVWFYWYPHTLQGLLTCFTLALPFYTHTLIGDLLFGYGYLAAIRGYKLWNAKPSALISRFKLTTS